MPAEIQLKPPLLPACRSSGAQISREAAGFLEGEIKIARQSGHRQNFRPRHDDELDFAEVKGQENVERTLEIAAAGGHNADQPGTGKSMLAKRCRTILPPLTLQQTLESTKFTIVGLLSPGPRS